MTTTILHSTSRKVRIGFDHPLCVIGERINPTGRELLAVEMAAGDFGRVGEEARAQVATGAHMLNVNAGIPLTDEAALLAQCVVRVQAVTDVPLAIDSSVVSALAKGARGLSAQSPRQLSDGDGDGVKLSSTALAVRLVDRCIFSGPSHVPEHHQIGFRLH